MIVRPRRFATDETRRVNADHACGPRLQITDLGTRLAQMARGASRGTYLRPIYVDTTVFTPHRLTALLAVFGPGRVMMGTDYPFDMGEYDPIGHIHETPGLDAATEAAPIGGNASRLLGVT